MKDVNVPKGYKSTDVGVIPKDRKIELLGNLFTFKNGVNADKKHYGKGIKFINVLEIIQKDCLFYKDIPGFISLDTLLIQQNIVKKGDVLFNRTSETQEEVGLTAVYLDDKDVVFGGFVIRAKPITDLINHYYSKYGFSSKAVRNQVIKRGQGAVRANIGQSDLKTILFPLPPLPEQKTIARVLSDVDDLIRECDSLLAKKRDIKQGTMQQLLTGKKRLPGFSGEWEEKKLGDCLIKNPDYGINAPAVPYSDNLPIYIRITDISEDGKFLPETKVSVNHPQSSKYLLENNDIVLARTGASTGKSYLYNQKDGELVFPGFLIRVKADCKLLDSRYLKGFLQTQQYWNWVTVMSMRSGQPGINGNEYAQLKIPIPPTLPEQRAIAEILSDMDAAIEALEQKRDKYKAIKQGMMQELLTGKTRLIDS